MHCSWKPLYSFMSQGLTKNWFNCNIIFNKLFWKPIYILGCENFILSFVNVYILYNLMGAPSLNDERYMNLTKLNLFIQCELMGIIILFPTTFISWTMWSYNNCSCYRTTQIFLLINHCGNPKRSPKVYVLYIIVYNYYMNSPKSLKMSKKMIKTEIANNEKEN